MFLESLTIQRWLARLNLLKSRHLSKKQTADRESSLEWLLDFPIDDTSKKDIMIRKCFISLKDIIVENKSSYVIQGQKSFNNFKN